MRREMVLIFQSCTCRLFVLIVWLIKSLLANSFALFIIHAARASELIWWGFLHTRMSAFSSSCSQRRRWWRTRSTLRPKKKRWPCCFWPWWMKWVMGWSWIADRPVLPAAPIIPQVLGFGPKQPAPPDWPSRLIYVNCIIKTKRLNLLPSGSVGVKSSKVFGFTDGGCSGLQSSWQRRSSPPAEDCCSELAL